MALSPAEKMRAYRERQKANNQKQVSFLIDADIAEKVTSYAEQHQTTQADVFNNLLRQGLDGNKLPNNDTVTSYQKEIDLLNTELAAAKTQILELLSVENKVFYFTWNDIPRKLKKGVNYWELGDDKEGASFFPVQFIHDDLITHEGGAWFIELENQKIEMTTSDQQEIKRLNAELVTAKANNERLVLKYDSEYLRANGLQNQVTELKRQPDKLRAEITRLKHLEQDCQAIKANGERCNKPAKGKVNFHGVLINVCLQHQNQLMKN